MAWGASRFGWVAILCACSSTPAGSAAPPADAGAPAVDAPADASLDTARPVKVPCGASPDDRPPGASCLLEVHGALADRAGAALADHTVSLCGSTCYGTQTGPSGAFVIPVGELILRDQYAIHVDGRPDHADYFLRLAKGDDRVLTLAAPLLLPVLPATGPVLPPDGGPDASITSGDLTLGVEAGTTFDLAIEDFGKGDAARMLRVASVPLADAPPFAVIAGFEATYAIAPSEVRASKKMRVTLKNAAALPPGAAVEILMVGDDFVSVSPTVGIAQVVAAGHVSADGASITSDPGEGVTVLTWLGVRRKGNG
jgi:hypothetical protein